MGITKTRIAVAALAAFAIACGEEPPTSASAPEPVLAKGGKGGPPPPPPPPGGGTIDLDAAFDPAEDITGDGGGPYFAHINESGNLRTQIGVKNKDWKANEGRCVNVHVADAANPSVSLFGPECVRIDNLATAQFQAGDVNLATMAVGDSGPITGAALFSRAGKGKSDRFQLYWGRITQDCVSTPALGFDPTKRLQASHPDADSWILTGADVFFCQVGSSGPATEAVATLRITGTRVP